MKATKNQANAVRTYLATLGVSISHVQALEVIARGAGERSRHVKAVLDATPAQPEAVDAFALVLALRDDYVAAGNDADASEVLRRAAELFPELFGDARGRDALEELFEASETASVSLESEAACMAGALRNAYVQSGRTQAAQAAALKALVRHCGELFDNYEDAYLFLVQFDETADRLAREGNPRREVQAGASMDEVIEDIPDHAMQTAQAIKAEYDASPCQAADVDHAVHRLMTECGNLFIDDRYAWSFINEEAHEELDEESEMDPCAEEVLRGEKRAASGLLGEVPVENGYLLLVESPEHGRHGFPFSSDEKRRRALMNMMAKAVELNDGVVRHFFYSSGAHCPCTEVGAIDEARHVHFEGKDLGTIAGLTEGGLTLYSWIDDDPDAE